MKYYAVIDSASLSILYKMHDARKQAAMHPQMRDYFNTIRERCAAELDSREIFNANLNRLHGALDLMQRNLRARTVSEFDIISELSEIESKGIRGKNCKGVTVEISIHAQRFPAAYHGIPYGTVIRATYNGKSWCITNIFRGVCNRGKKIEFLSGIDEVKTALYENAF